MVLSPVRREALGLKTDHDYRAFLISCRIARLLTGRCCPQSARGCFDKTSDVDYRLTAVEVFYWQVETSAIGGARYTRWALGILFGQSGDAGSDCVRSCLHFLESGTHSSPRQPSCGPRPIPAEHRAGTRPLESGKRGGR